MAWILRESVDGVASRVGASDASGRGAAPEAPLASVTRPFAVVRDEAPLALAEIRVAVVAAFPGADTRARGATQRLWVV